MLKVWPARPPSTPAGAHAAQETAAATEAKEAAQ
jgi:hypothetical protein